MILIGFNARAQYDPNTLYIPRNIKQAYANGTRSMDGRPGKNYWQNHSRYDIHINVDPKTRKLEGHEQIVYFNNSPDTLNSIVFRLTQNVHKPGAVLASPRDSTFFTSGIHIDSFSENDSLKPWDELPYFNTFQRVRLSHPLMPGDSMQFAFQWHYTISLSNDREGMIDSTTFYIGYFYPRVAVYDDYEGWNTIEFNNFIEFYNDFNDYTLSVEVPGNYAVWATGRLLNISDVMQPEIAERFKKSESTDDPVHVITQDDWKAKKVTRENEMNTWKWKAGNVSDVSVVISDHFDWDASSIVVDNAAGRRASVQAVYCDTVSDFKYEIGMEREALNYLSHVWPGVPYPYEKTVVVQSYNGGGMEYPMMVNESTFGNDTSLQESVVSHEIAHTYMPFYMGINETQYAFMDEGWATTFEYLIDYKMLGKEKADKLFKGFNVIWTIYRKGMLHDHSQDYDMPDISPSPNLSTAYEMNAYGKPSLAYLALKDYLGDEMFGKCLHEYMNRWHGKHPMPWDFFYTFNDASGKNLNWFWNNWFFSNNYMDIGIRNVSQTRGGYTLDLDNIGGMAMPFDVKVTWTDGSVEVIHQTPGVWEKSIKSASIKIDSKKKKLKSIVLDGGIYMDANEKDNTWMNNK